ncbi:hypothetical protein S245_068404 [Arachis hypogaea]
MQANDKLLDGISICEKLVFNLSNWRYRGDQRKKKKKLKVLEYSTRKRRKRLGCCKRGASRKQLATHLANLGPGPGGHGMDESFWILKKKKRERERKPRQPEKLDGGHTPLLTPLHAFLCSHS